jgi:hypothetical protein
MNQGFAREVYSGQAAVIPLPEFETELPSQKSTPASSLFHRR